MLECQLQALQRIERCHTHQSLRSHRIGPSPRHRSLLPRRLEFVGLLRRPIWQRGVSHTTNPSFGWTNKRTTDEHCRVGALTRNGGYTTASRSI
jgi:hypothetical protein